MKVGGQDYCSVCGTLYGATSAVAQTATGLRRMTDLAPRRSAAPAAASVTVQAAATPKSAAALHSRVKRSHVLDLRESDAPAEPPAIVKALPAVQPIASQPAVRVPASAPRSTAHERHLAHISDRLSQAKQVSRSPQINKFAGGGAVPAQHLRTATTPAPVVAPPPPSVPVGASAAAPAPARADRELPALAQTQHEALARMAPAAVAARAAESTPKTKPAAGWRPHLALSPHRGQVAATMAAVVIMAGYVWVQNYPKLALQSASNKAGLSASFPTYLPSSYNLSRTDTAPGSITLSFSSPSASQALKIAQTRTSWDSASLLDNFVAKEADGYATVQGRGLTIYLFNDNRATWVNHGTWFSIEGAARLSREQILKMAYSL